MQLQETFQALHRGRSETYRFGLRPGDFQTALRNLTGTFITVRGATVEFLDPSVIDLMNAVLRDEPSNALDVVAAAVSMSQIQRTWALSELPGNELLRSACVGAPNLLVDGLRRTLSAKGRVEGAGGIAWFGPSLEERVLFILEIAHLVRTPAMFALAEEALDGLILDWGEHDEAEFREGVSIAGIVKSSDWVPGDRLGRFYAPLRQELYRKAAKDASPDDALEVLKLPPEDGLDLEALAVGVRHWLTHGFPGRLRELRSGSEFEELLDQLTALQSALDLDAEGPIDAIKTQWEEFERHEDAYVDSQMDEHKERWRDERDRESSMRDLFDSLEPDED